MRRRSNATASAGSWQRGAVVRRDAVSFPLPLPRLELPALQLRHVRHGGRVRHYGRGVCVGEPSSVLSCFVLKSTERFPFLLCAGCIAAKSTHQPGQTRVWGIPGPAAAGSGLGSAKWRPAEEGRRSTWTTTSSRTRSAKVRATALSPSSRAQLCACITALAMGGGRSASGLGRLVRRADRMRRAAQTLRAPARGCLKRRCQSAKAS